MLSTAGQQYGTACQLYLDRHLATSPLFSILVSNPLLPRIFNCLARDGRRQAGYRRRRGGSSAGMNSASDIQAGDSSSIGVQALHAARSASSAAPPAAMLPDVSALLQQVAAATKAAAASVANIAAPVTALDQAQQSQGQNPKKDQAYMPTRPSPRTPPSRQPRFYRALPGCLAPRSPRGFAIEPS